MTLVCCQKETSDYPSVADVSCQKDTSDYPKPSSVRPKLGSALLPPKKNVQLVQIDRPSTSECIERGARFNANRASKPETRVQEGKCKASWKRQFKLPWREAGPPDHYDDKVDSDQKVVNKALYL